MWPFSRAPKELRPGPVFLTNTLGGQKESFVPLRPGGALVYSCGPTVYSQQHIGNLRAAVFSDILARVLTQNGYRVRRVTNITDVGHLTGDNEGDASQGEDRMEKSARESGITAQDIAERYTARYLEDIRSLGINTNEIQFPHATQYIPEQIAMVKMLEKEGHTYRTRDGVYFDVSTFPGYGKLGNIPQDLIKHGNADSTMERIALAGHGRIKENKEKRNAADFALWKSSPPGVVRQQEWSSPWGRGFPGWHLECSAMIKALLGESIDIHTGGIEHIPVHHNNEIAQSESVNGKVLSRFWVHGAHLTLGGEKIAKSLGNAIYLSDIVERGYHPLSLRYFFLQASYRSQLSFTWETLAASHEALGRLWGTVRAVKAQAKDTPLFGDESERIRALAADDLATPRVLAALWEILRDDELSPKRIWGAVLTADAILGISLAHPPHATAAVPVHVPDDVVQLVKEREEARVARDFARADEVRIHIENRGYAVEDSANGPKIHSK